MEFVVTLDESWIELSDCNRKRRICYISKEKNTPENWVYERKESFPPKFTVIGNITGRGVLPLIDVPDNTKVDSHYYIDYVLTPLVYKYLLQLYTMRMSISEILLVIKYLLLRSSESITLVETYEKNPCFLSSAIKF
jgi:hypothetical protein